MTQNIAPSEYVKQIMNAGNMEEKAALVLYMRCVRSAKAAGHHTAGPAALALAFAHLEKLRESAEALPAKEASRKD